MRSLRWSKFSLIISMAIFLSMFYSTIATTAESRWVDVDGVKNFRDVGGYDTPDGTLKWGVLFRSADLSGITPEGIETLKELGIVTLVDLKPEPISGDIEGILKDAGFVVVKLPMERDTLKDKAEFYRRIIVKGRKSLTELLSLLSDSKNLPMVIFDEGGVSEVEVATMFVLGACGVQRENIISDYLLSNTIGAGLNEEWGGYIVQYFDEYGGIDYYITSILKISPEIVNNIKNNLLER